MSCMWMRENGEFVQVAVKGTLTQLVQKVVKKLFVKYMTHRVASVRLSCHKYKAIVPGATELNINGSSYVYTILSVAPS